MINGWDEVMGGSRFKLQCGKKKKKNRNIYLLKNYLNYFYFLWCHRGDNDKLLKLECFCF